MSQYDRCYYSAQGTFKCDGSPAWAQSAQVSAPAAGKEGFMNWLWTKPAGKEGMHEPEGPYASVPALPAQAPMPSMPPMPPMGPAMPANTTEGFSFWK